MMRTHGAGTLRAEDAGAPATLAGWVAARRDHGGVVFFDLRDSSGVTQVVVDPEQVDSEDVHHIGREWVLQVEGDVRPRPEGTVNPDLPTGAVELAARTVTVLNRAEAPPFPISEHGDDVDEVLRLRHRYLDLRRPSMQHNLRLRSAVNAALRTSMTDQGFVEVETPMLIASTPEGARGLRRAVASQPRRLLRPAAEPAAVQAAADGGRTRPLLPDRALPARRGPAGQPAVRVHAVRHGDELRRAGGRPGRRHDRGERGGGGRDRRTPRRGAHHHLGRRDGALRLGQAGHPLRHGADRPRRGRGGNRVQGLPGPRGEGRPCPGPRRLVPLDARRARRARQAARCRRVGLDAGARRRGARVADRQVPERGRADRHRRHARRDRAIWC